MNRIEIHMGGKKKSNAIYKRFQPQFWACGTYPKLSKVEEIFNRCCRPSIPQSNPIGSSINNFISKGGGTNYFVQKPHLNKIEGTYVGWGVTLFLYISVIY